MRLISVRSWVLVAVSAGLQILMFPTGGPVPAWRPALCWVALVPLLVGLAGVGREGAPLGVRSSWWLGYLCGFLWFFGNCFWIYQTMYLYGGLPKPVAFGIVILFSLYLGLYSGLFAVLFAVVRRGAGGPGGALLVSPALWVAVELARARVTGFPWDLVGNAPVDNLLVTRIAPVAGVMGISLLVAAVNAGLASFLVWRGRKRWIVPGLAGAVAILLCAGKNWPGGVQQVLRPARAVLLQENLSVGVEAKGSRESTGEELEAFTGASLNASVGSGPGERPQATVIVWPEAPSHLQSNDPGFRAEIGELAREAQAPVIAGSLGVDADATAARGYYLYDSASLFDETGKYQGRYDKIHLVPWGEYVPFKRFFSFAQKLTEGVGDMDAGHERTVFRSGGHAYGVFVCYESIFGDEVREFAKGGAEVLVNISDDGWYGETGAPWQHLNMARMRAIENGRYVLRSTNTGVTTVVDPLGRVEAEAPRHVRGAFVFPFAFVEGTTFYTRHGDWLAYLCALVTVGALGISVRKGERLVS